MNKCIKISEETHRRLIAVKAENYLKNLDETLRLLLAMKEKPK